MQKLYKCVAPNFKVLIAWISMLCLIGQFSVIKMLKLIYSNVEIKKFSGGNTPGPNFGGETELRG
jgi:hypothetical protein